MPIWDKTNLTRFLEGIKEEETLFGTNKQIRGRYGELTDFGSDFYQKYRQFLGSMTPSPGANSFLSMLQAGGGNFGASQVQAQQLQRGAEGRRQDFLNTSTSQFALGSQAQADSLLGLLSGNQQFMAKMAQRRKEFDESQGGFLDFLGDVGGFLTAGLIPGLPFPGSGGGRATQAGGRF